MDFHSFLKEYQPFVYQTFKNALSSNKISQAYLIKGCDGAPVLECAKYLAKSLICNDDDGFACNSCIDCIRFDEGNYADFMFIDGSQRDIKVTDIEALQEFLSSTSLEKKNKKIYIIHLLENSNKESVNALLKTLEEPTPNVYAFITTKNESKLLPTILSRCQILNLLPFEKKIILEEAKKEGIQDDDAEILSCLYGNIETIKEISTSESYLKAKEALNYTLDSLNISVDEAIFSLETKILSKIKTKEETRLFIDLLSIAFKDILKLNLNADITLNSYKEKLDHLKNKLKSIEKTYLEIMLTRGKIDMNVFNALLLEHIFIYIKEVN